MLTMSTPEQRAQRAAYMREYNRRNPRRVKGVNIKARYGMTIEEYEAKLAEQNDLCACCLRPFNPDPRMRDHQIDHNHETGEFRGIVCAKCNYILGRVDKDVEILRLAVAYLEARVL